MNIFQSKHLFSLRQAFKHFLSFIYPLVVKIFPLPKVKSIDDTIDKIINEKCSICRFGDGEIMIITDKVGLPFQKFDSELREKMMAILKSNDDKILVGMPVGFYSLNNLTKKGELTWRSVIVWTYPRFRKYLDLNKVYYNTSMTRPYIDFEKKADSKRYFEKLMKIWVGREILLIEGEKSRLGVKNNLFASANSVERILAPANNAFSKYEQLLNEAQKHNKSKLILIALGPTATVLAYELARSGYQAIDIGHIDIEYEWFLQGATYKVKIPGKYSAETKGGREVEDIVDSIYQSQIIRKIL